MGNEMNEDEARGQALYDSLSVDDRIAITAYLFHVIANHRGTYRWLIYDTLGLPVKAGTYGRLYPDGLTISNILFDAYDVVPKLIEACKLALEVIDDDYCCDKIRAAIAAAEQT